MTARYVSCLGVGTDHSLVRQLAGGSCPSSMTGLGRVGATPDPESAVRRTIPEEHGIDQGGTEAAPLPVMGERGDPAGG